LPFTHFDTNAKEEGQMLKKITRYLRDERGAEMVEWVVVVVVLAVVASIVFGPNGVLRTAVETGINKISNIITALPTSS
jgi:Flp pilus assembly pilin Flp